MKEVDTKHAEGELSVCVLRAGDGLFGVETRAVREAIEGCEVREVPLAPKFVAGVMAYRGEVLVAVSLRWLLGLAPEAARCRGVVLQEEDGEMFAVLVDEVRDVVQVAEGSWEPNPMLLDERQRQLFGGVTRTDGGSLVRLNAERLRPSWLMEHLDRASLTGD